LKILKVINNNIKNKKSNQKLNLKETDVPKLFRIEEFEKSDFWNLFFKNVIYNFIKYGFAIIKYKKNEYNELVPEVLHPYRDCKIGFFVSDKIALKFMAFNTMNKDTVTTINKDDAMKKYRILTYSPFSISKRLFESKIYNILNTAKAYAKYMVNHQKTNNLLTNPPRIFSTVQRETEPVTTRPRGEEDASNINIINGNNLLFRNLNDTEKLEETIKHTIDQSKLLNQTLNRQNDLINQKDYKKHNLNAYNIRFFEQLDKLTNDNLLKEDKTLPISIESLIPEGFEIKRDNEIKNKVQPDQGKIIQNLTENICLGLGVKVDLILPSSYRQFSASQKNLINEFGRLIGNWQKKLINDYIIVYSDLIIYSKNVFKKVDELVNYDDEGVKFIFQHINVDISFKPNLKLTLEDLSLFERLNDKNKLADKNFLKFLIEIYGLPEFIIENNKKEQDGLSKNDNTNDLDKNENQEEEKEKEEIPDKKKRKKEKEIKEKPNKKQKTSNKNKSK